MRGKPNPTTLDITFDDPAWPDLIDSGAFFGNIVGMTLAEGVTNNGKPAVVFRIELVDPEGGPTRPAIVGTTVPLFLTAAGVIKGRLDLLGYKP